MEVHPQHDRVGERAAQTRRSTEALEQRETSRHPPKKTRTRTSRNKPMPSLRPKRVRVGRSGIPNAGNGLFVMEDIKKGEFVARYSGEAISREECMRRSSHYRLRIHRGLYLDAENPTHFEGRHINDGQRSRRRINVRFASDYGTNVCANTGFHWIKIFATRNIKAGSELFLNYGDDFWSVPQTASATGVTSAPPPPHSDNPRTTKAQAQTPITTPTDPTPPSSPTHLLYRATTTTKHTFNALSTTHPYTSPCRRYTNI